MRAERSLGIFLLAISGGSSVAQSVSNSTSEPASLSAIVVTATLDNSIGTSDSASAGVIDGDRLNEIPLLRPADVLENIPGMVVTQHSGSGKANQYYLRGFNLDHGTDFATKIQGVPVNMPTNAHGQGYIDLNYLIPELVERVDYRKGPYFAPNSDFSSAGSADIFYRSRLEQNIANLTLGQYGYQRLLLAGSTSLGSGTGSENLNQGPVLLGALDVQRSDGPWTTKEALQKANALLRLTDGTRAKGWSLDAVYYNANWNSTDQVPLKLLERGRLDRYSSLDPTDGGNTERAIISGEWHSQDNNGYINANAYAQHYSLNLWSNFTYFLDRPDTCDQFHQSENRNFMGGGLTRGWHHKLFGNDSTTEAGLQFRYDSIRVGLSNTQARRQLDAVTDDQVNQSLTSAYLQNSTNWTQWMRTVVGARADYINMNSTSFILAENSGNAAAVNVSPKFSLILGPWEKTEFFFNAGGGIHSNDARGVIYKIDPTTGLASSQVPALAATTGMELGLRTEIVKDVKSSLALWTLKSGSELVYSADSGTTAPKDASKRYGVEWNNEINVNRWLRVDADLAWTNARYASMNANVEVGNMIPNAVSQVGQLTATLRNLGPWSASAQLQYIGAYPLSQDGNLTAPSTTVINMRIQHEFSANAAVALDVLNLLDRQYYDIAYQQDYRISPFRPITAGGITVHPGEPRQIRLTLMLRG
jgi:hypothetical protein